MTRQSVLGEVGNLNAPPGSHDWAIAVCLDIQETLNHVSGDAENLEAMINLIRQHEGWKQLLDRRSKKFRSYRTFCVEPQPFGLGYDPKAITAIISEWRSQSAQQLAADERVKPLAPDAGRPKGNVDNINIRPNGTAASYIVRRLKRDHPEIAEALGRGEYPSARAAGIAAGFIKVPTALDQLQKAWAKATALEQEAFLTWLEGGQL